MSSGRALQTVSVIVSFAAACGEEPGQIRCEEPVGYSNNPVLTDGDRERAARADDVIFGLVERTTVESCAGSGPVPCSFSSVRVLDSLRGTGGFITIRTIGGETDTGRVWVSAVPVPVRCDAAVIFVLSTGSDELFGVVDDDLGYRTRIDGPGFLELLRREPGLTGR